MATILDQMRLVNSLKQKQPPTLSGRVVSVDNTEKGLYRTYRVRTASGLTITARGVSGIAIGAYATFTTTGGQNVIVDGRTTTPESTARVLV